MDTDLIRQVNANHEILLAKISRIESLLEKNPNLSTASNVNNNVVDKEFIAERQRIESSNESLRNEIKNLIEGLKKLETQTKGNNPKLFIPPSTSVAERTNETKIVEEKPKAKQQKETKEKVETAKQKTSKPKSNELTTEDRLIDASRLDLRIGKIIDVKKHPDANSLYVEQIDCGEDKPRTVVSGLVKFIPLEEMENRMVVVLCNLKPAKMRGIISEAMVMCASTPEKVEILSPPEGVVPGDRVTFGKYPGVPDIQLNPKKKIWEQIAPDLSTNENLEATYKGDSFIVQGKGPIKSQTLKNVPVK